MQDLGTLGGNCAGVGGLNERGQIVGGSTTSAIANSATGFPPQDPFLWERGKGMIDLGTLGGVFGGAAAINNHSQIIGQSSVAVEPGACNGFPDNNDLNCHAFLWDHGRLTDLTTSTIGGSPVGVAGINDAGEIVGWGVFPNAPQKEEAFFWRKGVATDLGTLGDCYAVAHTINSASQVVGLAYSFTPGLPGFPCEGNDARAFLWEKGSTVDLNTLIPHGSSLELSDAMDINDRGEIDGIGVPPGVPSINFVTQGHGFLLIPCDENHPNLEGCDYSLTDGSASTNLASKVASTESTANQISTPDVVRRLLRASGLRSTSWFRVLKVTQ